MIKSPWNSVSAMSLEAKIAVAGFTIIFVGWLIIYLIWWGLNSPRNVSQSERKDIVDVICGYGIERGLLPHDGTQAGIRRVIENCVLKDEPNAGRVNAGRVSERTERIFNDLKRRGKL
jgi:hypothetical protein